MKGKIIVLVVILAGLALLSGNAAIAQPTSLTVHVQDESGFPPASEGGVRDISVIPVALYTPGGDLVVEGATNASGGVTVIGKSNYVGYGEETAVVSPVLHSGTDASLRDVGWKPDGSYALIVGSQGTVLKYDGTDFTPLNAGTTMDLFSVTWKPDGSYALITGGSGNAQKLVLKHDGISFTTLDSGFGPFVEDSAFKPDGSYALIVGYNNYVRKYDGTSLTTLISPWGHYSGVAFKPDGSQALITDTSAPDTKTVKFDGTTFTQLPTGVCSNLQDVAWKPDGAYALVVGSGGTVLKYDGTTILPLSSGTTESLNAVGWKGDGSQALIVGGMVDYFDPFDPLETSIVLKYDGASFEPLSFGITRTLFGLGWKPDGSYALIVGNGGSVLNYQPEQDKPHKVYLPLVAKNFWGPIAKIEWETPTGFQPLDGVIVPDTTVTIRITLMIELDTVQVTLTPGAGIPDDITDQFGDLLATRQGTATLTLPGGDYTVAVMGTSRGQPQTQTAGMAILDPDSLVTSSALTFDLIVDPAAEISYEAETILLAFANLATTMDMSDFLRRNGLVPLDLALPAGLVRARIMTGETPIEVMERLTALGAPILLGSVPNVVVERDDAVGERMPERLTGSYLANAGAGCVADDNVIHGCFDYSGDPDNNNPDELRIFRYHFFMDTFAAHRLVEHLVAAPAQNAGLAIIDAGLGNGANVTDIPNAELFNISQEPFWFNNQGIQTQRWVGGAWIAGAPTIADIPDDADGHGTSVTMAAAGRASVAMVAGRRITQTLGTGLHVQVRPMKDALPWSQRIYAVLGAIRDPNVDVINTSWGAFGLAANEFLALAMEGTTWNVVRLAAQPYLDYGLDGNRNAVDADGTQGNGRFDFTDTNLNGRHDAGEPSEPFYDGNGNNRFDQGDAKIWVASNGNVGRDIGNTRLPAAFAPDQNPRGDNDPTDGFDLQREPTILAVSASETENRVRGPEQLRFNSNWGERTSVAAPGGERLLPNRDGNLRPISGTSFAAPTVAGLAAEMIYLNRNINPAANRLTPLQIIEIIEATADNLGTTTGGDMVTRPNNDPGNDSPDQYFGHGRINVWKAILAVANGGIATDRSAVFPSLDDDATDGDGARVIDDSETAWYGFNIHSPVHEATVWLDGVQLTDGHSTAPGGISAYAGVRSDRVIMIGINDDNKDPLDEDPTSGIVPLGNKRGEYLATFSIEGGQLRAAEKLELRTGNNPNEKPFYVLDVSDTQAMREGKVPGVVFDDYVFHVTPTDFGDADPTKNDYHVTLEITGAHHLNTTLEWFGQPGRPNEKSVSGEIDADDEKDTDTVPNVKDEDDEDNDIWDMDARDDGVVFFTETFVPTGTGRVDFTLCVADEDSGRYANHPDRSLYVNAWIDWNADRDWDDDREYILDGAQIVPTNTNFIIARQPTGTATITTTGNVISHCQEFKAKFPLPAAISRDGLWARFRVDYGEDVGRNNPSEYDKFPNLENYRGPARHGEVEDYFLKGDFGDADPNYPTRLRDNGARHVETKHEWFGRFTMGHDESVSEEYDAVDPIDIDGTPNLRDDGYDLDRFDDGVLFFPLTYRPGERGKLLFNVCVEQLGDRYDPNDPDKTLYVNAWIDWDTDWTWEEMNQEHIINGLKLAPKDANSWDLLGLRDPATTVTLTLTSTNCARYLAEFDVGDIDTEELWARFRLDYGEDVGCNDPRPLFRSDDSLRDPDLDEDELQPAGQGIGYTEGAARFGEVEDYLIGSDFGDAPDPFIGVPGEYPTRKVSDGARHLDMNREWLGWPDIYASVTRETDGWDLTLAEEDRVPNLDFNGLGGNLDGKDDGVVLPFQVQPGQLIFVEIDVSAQIDSRGFANRGPNDEDSEGILTLKPNCTLGPIPDMEDTPVQHRDQGRYSAWDPEKRLYLNVWADWNNNGIWEDSELVITGPLDPEDWGPDGKYTLGEPFTDLDNNDVWTANEPYTPTTGIPLRHLTCPVGVPPWVQLNQDFYWRFRLDYGENVATDDTVIHHATEDNRLLNNTYGGALWGEVEDYPMYAYKPILYDVYSAFALVDWFEFELEGGPPAQFLVTAQETYTGAPIYALELFFADQDPVWTDVLPLGWPAGWDWDLITGGIDELAGIRLYTEDEDCALEPGDSLWFMLAPFFEGQTWPSDIWMHATDFYDVNLGYVVSEAWVIETVDSATEVGLYNSLALDSDGYPHISYYDQNLHILKYARWTGTAWDIQTVDGVYGSGLYTSLALDSSGNPHISYYVHGTGDLKYARRDGSQWMIETVDHIGNVGSYSSLALDGSDEPHISYLDYTNGDLKYARWMGDFWLIQTVDYEGIVGYATSLALDDAENAHISYYDLTNGDLKYAWGDGEFWSIETVDTSGDVGKFSSLALDVYGSPHISYFDETNDDLKYAQRMVVGKGLQSTWWDIETVDSEGTVGESTSLALDGSGNPHISYHDITNANLEYGWWTGDAWRFQKVASAGDSARFASLALDRAGKPHIAFYDDASEVLKYARQADSGFPVVYDFDYALNANGDLATVGEYLNNDVFLSPDYRVRFERSGETRATVDGGGTLRLERDGWDEDDLMFFVHQQPLPETYVLSIKDLWRTHPGTGAYAELSIGYTDDDSPPRLANLVPDEKFRTEKFVVLAEGYYPNELRIGVYYRDSNNDRYNWQDDHWEDSWGWTLVMESGFNEDLDLLYEIIKDHQGYRARVTRLDTGEVLLETTPVPPDAMVASDKLDFALFGAYRWWIGESYVAHFDDWSIIPLGDADGPCGNWPSDYNLPFSCQ